MVFTLLILFILIDTIILLDKDKQSNYNIIVSPIGIDENYTTIKTIKIYADLSDGYSKYLGRAGIDSWYDVRNAAIGNQKNDTTPWYMKGILASFNNKTGPLYVISRSFFAFNTSILDDEAIITEVELCIYGHGANESSVCAVAWNDGADGVDYDDYGAVGDINFGNTSNWINNGYNVIKLNTRGIEYIDKTGYTYLACREYPHDFLDHPPKGVRLDENRNGHYFADEPGTDKDPYLSITYTLNPSTSNNLEDKNPSTPSTSITPLIIIIFLLILFKKFYDS